MSASFDPYHKWLGISADEQPASLYRLLGVRQFESDPDVIDTAADQRIRMLKTFQGGKHAALSQKLLNEISRARQRLLDVNERAAYDKLLREQAKRQASSANASGSGSVATRGSRWREGKSPETLNEFFECLAASGLMTEDEAQRLVGKAPADKRPCDPKSLAQELIRAGKLTKYQAVALLQGKLKYLTFGEYLILDKLGQGGMGQVMKAEHRRMKRIVALKLISGETLKNPDAISRFQREVQASARLIHPNIVTAFDANEHEGMHFYVMEYVEGQDLGAVVKQQGPLSVAQAVDYVVQAARGLAYAHGKGIVHRDMKPSNLLLDKEGTIKILDMGLARMDRGEEQHELTNTGQVLGTVDYMAPEQAIDTHTADHRADIYSLGCTLYRLLTGEPLYTGDSIMRKLLQHRDGALPDLKAKRPELPASVLAAWQKMVAKLPERRQQSMAEVVSELELCLHATPPTSVAPAADLGGDSINIKLNEFLSGISVRDSGKPSSGKSSSGSGSGVAVATKTRKAAVVAVSEATQNIQSGETDPNTIAQLRLTDSPSTSNSGSLSNTRLRKASKGGVPFHLIAYCAAVLTVLLGGTILAIIVTRRTPQPSTPSPAPVTVDSQKSLPQAKGEVSKNVTNTPAAVRSAKGSAPRNEPIAPTDRQAAEWAIGLGGSVAIAGVPGNLNAVEKLPPGDFKLQRLSVSNKPRMVTDDKIPLLRGLAQLTDLDLGGSVELATDKNMVALTPLKYLKQLNLRGSQITDASLTHFSDLTELTHLNLSGTKVTERGVELLRGLTRLRLFDLSGTKASEAVLLTASNWPDLNEMQLPDVAYTDAGLAGLSNFTSLTYVHLHSRQLRDEQTAVFAGLKKLTNLDLSGSSVTDAALVHLHACSLLTFANLRGTRVTSAGVIELQNALPKCRVDLDSGNQVSKLVADANRKAAEWVISKQGVVGVMAAGKRRSPLMASSELPPNFELEQVALIRKQFADSDLAVFEGLQAITTFSVANSDGLGDAGLIILAKLPSLHTLNLQGQSRISDAELERLRSLSKLKSLNLTNTRVSDSGLRFLQPLANLESLELTQTKVTDDGLAQFKAWTKLKSLTLDNTSITDSGLAELHALKALASLSLKQTKVTPAGVAALQAVLPQCKVEADAK